MEIKELVKRLGEFKQLRNTFELKIDDFIDEGKKASAEAQKEIDIKDRMGLDHICVASETYWEDLNKGIQQVEYGIKYVNEGISILEASYRRSIRFKEQKPEEKTSENKEV